MTGTWIKPEEATDPKYWGRHLRATVRFAEAVGTLWSSASPVLVEVGPRTTLATLARQQVKDRARQVAVSTLGDTAQAELPSLLAGIGQLWTTGADVDARAFYGITDRTPRRRVPLPTYAWDDHRYWIAKAKPKPAPAAVAAPAEAPAPPPAFAPAQMPFSPYPPMPAPAMHGNGYGLSMPFATAPAAGYMTHTMPALPSPFAPGPALAFAPEAVPQAAAPLQATDSAVPSATPTAA